MSGTWWQNLPLALILMPLMAAVVCSVTRAGAARRIIAWVPALCCAGMGALLFFTVGNDVSFVYTMGEIGAPFGNELRIGPAEALMGLTFSVITLFAVLGGRMQLKGDVTPQRMPLYGAMLCLMTAALSAITFTNDLFTAYVFIEITTIAACGLICATNRGPTLFAAARYMIMNLLGSGLFLLGLSMLYDLTGHLLFPQLSQAVGALLKEERYLAPLYLSFVLMTVGIAFKCALYPFHTWLPNAYASATATSSALLSSVISKIYIFLLIKIFFRASGAQVFARRIEDVLFAFSVAGILLGSVNAIRERHFSRMIAYSSVSQIGYIFLGISLGTEAGMAAALFHIMAHSAAKSMLFLSANKLRAVSDGGDSFMDLTGAGLRAPAAGLAFVVGACSLTGIPVLGGFASKVYLAQAGIALGGWRMIVLLGTLAVSTGLNAAYLLRTALTLYRSGGEKPAPLARDRAFTFAMAGLMVINVCLGVLGRDVMEIISRGIALFA